MAMSQFSWVYPTRYLTWEAVDNCKDATYPLKIYRFVPAEIVSVESAILQFSIEKFRSYETTTPSGGGSTSGASSATSTGANAAYGLVEGSGAEDTYAGTADEWFTVHTFAAEGQTTHTADCFWMLDISAATASAMSFRVAVGPTPVYFPAVSQNLAANASALDKNARLVVVTAYDVYGLAVVLQAMGHVAQDYKCGYYLRYFGTHTHDMPHTHTTPNHTHEMTYDIYEQSNTNPSISIKINGTDRTTALGGPWTSDQDDIDIAAYLNIGEWNKIELVPNQLLRLNASVIATAVV